MASFALQPGQVVGERYRLRQMIGAGGMGAVWSARDEPTGRDVALKFLHPALLRDPMLVQRFFQEGEMGTQLRHPFIIETYGSGRYQPSDAKDAIPYLVTELLDGEPLTDTLQRVGTLSLAAALEIMRDVSHAADGAHRAGILHRDLKPANIFLHRNLAGAVVPKVLDFGVSKLMDPALDVGLTTTGVLVGSPAYMSPEQALAKRDIDGRSDVWSIGAMLHRCLTGKSIFAVTGKENMLLHIVQVDVTLDGVDEFPSAVSELLYRCLRRNREERFATAQDLALAIDHVMRELGLASDLRALLPPEVLAPGRQAGVHVDATEVQTHAPLHTTLDVTAARRAGKPLRWALTLAGLAGVAITGVVALLVRPETPAAPPPSDFTTLGAGPSPLDAPTPAATSSPESSAPTAVAAPRSAESAEPPPSAPPSGAPPAGPATRKVHPPRPPDVARHPGF